MDTVEVIITVLLLCLLALGVYLAAFWTISRRKKGEHEGGRGEVPYKYLEEEAENARRKVAAAYAQETMPKITITPVQPRPNFPMVRNPCLPLERVWLSVCLSVYLSGLTERISHCLIDLANAYLTACLPTRLTDWETNWLTNWQTLDLTDWLTDWQTGWLTTDWLTGWLTTDWLTGWMTD